MEAKVAPTIPLPSAPYTVQTSVLSSYPREEVSHPR